MDKKKSYQRQINAHPKSIDFWDCGNIVIHHE